MVSNRLTDNDLFSIRCAASDSGNGDLSRLCSLALWGVSRSQRTRARNLVAKMVAL
jgi:hypothetical protein